MHIDSPMPSRLIEAISVRFLPLFLGTLPYALSPVGARDLKRSIEICVPLSSTNTRRLTSKREASHRHSSLAPSSRSEATGDFFERPPSREPADGAAHRRLGDLHARLIEESLAMLGQGQVGVPLQLRRQPLPQGLALRRGPTGDLHRLHAPRLAPPIEPALDGRARDSEEVLHLRSRDAAVYRGERLQPEVLRIGVHGPYSRVGPLLTQPAVSTKTLGVHQDVAFTALDLLVPIVTT